MYDILDKVNCPEDLKGLSHKEIVALAGEIREFLINNVTITGGHLASNLGIVELSVALLRVFNLPQDRVIYDVGHQSYVHKILTGRKDKFLTLRREDGISGFTKRSESEYDCFGAGHSSTSVSAALGFAEADALCGKDNFTIAVVGDGAFTGGMVYEALNNCSEKLRLIIILNDNEMSISKNVGNLSKRITKVRTTKGYMRFKRRVAAIFDSIPLIGHSLHKFFGKVKFMLKGAVYNLNFFENMGLDYLGPVDGNDYFSLENMLKEAKARDSSCLIHIKTKKGLGYDIAEKNPEKYHGISPESSCSKKCTGSFSSCMGETLCEVAEGDDKVCAITAAMSVGTGLDCFEKRFPARLFDVGIAEAHAVTFFAGLSAAGMKPVFAVYSTFLQRAYDSLLHDVALQELGGLICIDRAGFAHEDGATHHGIYDVAFLGQIDGITIYEPVSYASQRAMMKKVLSQDGLYAIRYSKGAQNDELVNSFFADGDFSDFGIRKAYDNDGRFDCDNIVITYGRIASEALSAARELNSEGTRLGVILLQTLSPLCEQAKSIAAVADKNCRFIFLEESIKNGGAGMLLREELEKAYGAGIDYRHLAINGVIPEQGELSSLYRKCGISSQDVINNCKNL